MNPTIRRDSTKDRKHKASQKSLQKASQKTRHHMDTPPVKEPDHSAKMSVNPGNDVDAVKLNPQAEADVFRDKRLVKDLQDNANRSDLTKHRREISATKEGKEDEDVDEEDAEGLLRVDQEPETTDLEVTETTRIADK